MVIPEGRSQSGRFFSTPSVSEAFLCARSALLCFLWFYCSLQEWQRLFRCFFLAGAFPGAKLPRSPGDVLLEPHDLSRQHLQLFFRRGLGKPIGGVDCHHRLI